LSSSANSHLQAGHYPLQVSASQFSVDLAPLSSGQRTSDGSDVGFSGEQTFAPAETFDSDG
jgi:hypothetical protein